MYKWFITIVTAVCLAGTAAAQSGDTVSPFIKTRAAIIAISGSSAVRDISLRLLRSHSRFCEADEPRRDVFRPWASAQSAASGQAKPRR